MALDERPPHYRSGQPAVWYHRTPERSNHYCPYCAIFVGPGSAVASNKEHLIGRKFVPVGYLSGDSFNFIFRSCESCNARKSAAEGHVSAVSLFNSRGRYEDSGIDELAVQKASKHLHPGGKGAVVEDASVAQEITFAPVPGATARISLVGPPQLDEAAVLDLASMQVQALFSMLTTKNPRVAETMRILPHGNIAILGYRPESDWGDRRLAEVTSRTWTWECPLLIIAAKGYFKAIFKRAPIPADGWFWALEWNYSVRVFGGIFQLDTPPAWVLELPERAWRPIPGGSGRYRLEEPLAKADDRLFSCREDTEPESGGKE